MTEYPCPSPITVDVRIAGGSLELSAEPRQTAQVEVTPYEDTDMSREAAEQTRVELTGDRLVISAPESGGGWALRWRMPRVRVVARVPTGSSARVRVAAADADCRGEWADINLAAASGSVAIAHATGEVSAHTASGEVRIGRVGGRLSAKTASGDVSVQQVTGAVDMKTASGDLRLDDAGGDVSAKSASGDVRIGAARHGTVRLATVSGNLSVGVVSGTGVWMDVHSVTGRTRSDLDVTAQHTGNGHQLTVQARAVSGNVDIHRVTPAAPAQT